MIEKSSKTNDFMILMCMCDIWINCREITLVLYLSMIKSDSSL